MFSPNNKKPKKQKHLKPGFIRGEVAPSDKRRLFLKVGIGAVVILVIGMGIAWFVRYQQQKNDSNTVSVEEAIEALNTQYEIDRKAAVNQQAVQTDSERLAQTEEQLKKQIAQDGNELAPQNLELYVSIATQADGLGDTAKAKENAKKALMIFDALGAEAQTVDISVVENLRRIVNE